MLFSPTVKPCFLGEACFGERSFNDIHWVDENNGSAAFPCYDMKPLVGPYIYGVLIMTAFLSRQISYDFLQGHCPSSRGCHGREGLSVELNTLTTISPEEIPKA